MFAPLYKRDNTCVIRGVLSYWILKYIIIVYRKYFIIRSYYYYYR